MTAHAAAAAVVREATASAAADVFDSGASSDKASRLASAKEDKMRKVLRWAAFDRAQLCMSLLFSCCRSSDKASRLVTANEDKMRKVLRCADLRCAHFCFLLCTSSCYATSSAPAVLPLPSRTRCAWSSAVYARRRAAAAAAALPHPAVSELRTCALRGYAASCSKMQIAIASSAAEG